MVLYVTLSAYLAQTARRLYGAYGYENPHTERRVHELSRIRRHDRCPPGRGGPLLSLCARGSSVGVAASKAICGRPTHTRCSKNSAACSARPQTESFDCKSQYQALGVRQSLYLAGDARAAVLMTSSRNTSDLAERRGSYST